MSRWSSYGLDQARSDLDENFWHVYRARLVNGAYEYDSSQHSRVQFPDPQQLLGYLNLSPQPQVSNTGYGSTEQASAEHDLTAGFQGLEIGSNNPFRNTQAGAVNPFASPPMNPFLNQQNNAAASYGPHHPRRYNTPAGHPGYGSSYSANAGGGYLAPGANPLQPDRRSSRRSATPAVTSRSERIGSSLGRSVSVQSNRQSEPPRSRTSLSHGPSRPTEQSTNLRGFKVLKPKEYRTFFKSGRVFKAFYTKTSESNNPFAEMLPFVVIRPSKHHSLCLAIHTYGGRGTTATHARTRDHVIIFTGKEPGLLEGENESILNRRPIEVERDPKGEALLPASRLNVAKVHTIDHDIPVAKLGKISPRDVERLRHYSGISASTQGVDDLVVEDDEEETEAAYM